MSHNELDNIESELLSEKADLKRIDFGSNKITNLGDIVDVSILTLQIHPFAQYTLCYNLASHASHT